MDLVCIDFNKVDPSKENILLLTHTFTKFSQAFVTPNQKAIIIVKILLDKWCYVYGIPAHIHSDKGCSFDNEVRSHLYAMYRIQQSTTMPYNSCGNATTERLNCTLSCSNHYPRSRRTTDHCIYHCLYLHIMPCQMILLPTSHISSCLDAKHQLYAMPGSGWQITITTFHKASVLGLINIMNSSLL